MSPEQLKQVRHLNMVARTAPGIGSRLVYTEGLMAQEPRVRSLIMEAVEKFDQFTAANDPHGENDFGAVEVEGVAVFWKIDYFERGSGYEYGSEKPWDARETQRVLTIMLREEY
jgi:hypothetical protein